MPLHIYGFFTLDMAGVMVGCRADAYTCPAGTFGGASVELGNARQEAGGRPVSPWTGGETFTGSACPPKRYLGEEDP